MKTTREVTIVNELGLHARPAAEFVRTASAFLSEISIIRQDRRYSAQSMMDVMLANLRCGDSATLEADGADAELAVTTLAALVERLVD